MKVAYLDSSIIVRYYLPNDPGRSGAAQLIDDPQTALVTGVLGRIEVCGALVRAARNARSSPDIVLDRFDQDLDDGVITVVKVDDQPEAERVALGLARSHGIRALDAFHIATAILVLPELVAPGDQAVFVSRDREQAAAAAIAGLTVE